jgi:hypothetical protein
MGMVKVWVAMVVLVGVMMVAQEVHAGGGQGMEDMGMGGWGLGIGVGSAGESMVQQEEMLIRGRMLASSTYYIGYGALTANRSPCPATAAGRSYYTPNCASSSGSVVKPYSRGCTAIARCSRG